VSKPPFASGRINLFGEATRDLFSHPRHEAISLT
jgi:hypothetical protein